MGFIVKAMELIGTRRKVAIVEQPVSTLQHPKDVLLKIIRADTCRCGIPNDTQTIIRDQVMHSPRPAYFTRVRIGCPTALLPIGCFIYYFEVGPLTSVPTLVERSG